MTKEIGNFELIDHGIENAQYFQGCGFAFTNFRNFITGIGDNPAEAIDDCLERMAMNGFETEDMEARILKQEGWKTLPITPETLKPCEDTFYCVSIRWNEKEQP